uniref:Exosome complex component 10 homolog n=1 Tax=Anopheles maculatus TaxID=74869 RepID=A0A182STN4_9DIPT
MIHDFNDNILERIHSNLDEMAGIRKTAPTVLVQSEVQVPVVPRYRLSGAWNEKQTREPVKATLITGINIARPQVKFKVPVDNSRINPFVPTIRDKPNSLKPLAVLPEYDNFGNIVSYLHPYEFELDRFKPAKGAFQRVTPEEPLLLEETPLLFIDKASQLTELMRDLISASEIAIDLEHHSYRSYQGFTCLMQLSTRSKDYIVDALALRDELHVLNEVFTDPKKLKVLHGSTSDIEWLQRDLGLYLVNMFDTGEAARVLQLSRIGLQFLLKHYCNIDTDKAFQLADWRIRPIPDNFIEYARKDTHYLLYIYDKMKNELLDKGEGLLQTVFDKSTFICKQRYQKPTMNEDTVMNIYRRSRYVFDHRQMYAFREILYWRDQMARLEDESPGYVLPQHMAFDIASKLPREIQGIIACCTPVPSLVRQHLHTLHQIILKARDLPPVAGNQPQTKEQHADTRYKIQSAFDFDNPLVCPHDNTGHTDAAGGTNHPTLLGDLTNTLNAVTLMPQVNSNLLKDVPDMGIFVAPKIQTIDSRGRVGLNENDVSKEKYAKLLSLHTNAPQTQADNVDAGKYERNKFNTPFERYQETCRLRQLKERKDENLQKQQQQAVRISDVSNQPEIDSTSNAAAIEPLNQAPPASLVVPKKEDKTSQLQPHLMTQNQLKRLEEMKKRKSIAAGEQLRFDGTTVVTERPSAAANQSQGKRKSFPMEINVSGSAETIEQNLATVNGGEKSEATKKEKPTMAPYKDESKSDAHNESASWKEKKGKTKKAKQRQRNLMKSSIGQGSHQSSNKPIVPFDYNNVDFSRFQGGSKPVAAPRKGKRGGGALGNLTLANDGAGEGSSVKKLHPNSRIAKNIKQTQKLFNLSSSNMKRK